MDAPRSIKYIPDMQILPGKVAAARIAGILHPKYQVHGYSIDLTARKIFSIDPIGQIDFGGNESIDLAENEIALIEADDRLLRAGAWHVPMYLRGRVEPVKLLLKGGAARLRVKENARLARFRLFRFAEEAKTDSSSSKSKPQIRKIPGRKKLARS